MVRRGAVMLEPGADDGDPCHGRAFRVTYKKYKIHKVYKVLCRS